MHFKIWVRSENRRLFAVIYKIYIFLIFKMKWVSWRKPKSNKQNVHYNGPFYFCVIVNIRKKCPWKIEDTWHQVFKHHIYTKTVSGATNKKKQNVYYVHSKKWNWVFFREWFFLYVFRIWVSVTTGWIGFQLLIINDIKGFFLD